MKIVTEQAELDDLCAGFAEHPFVTVDTEFLRERTYWPQLCLVQMARPGEGEEGAVAVDPLAAGLDLAPIHRLLADERVVKVFHAARQDVEIFHHFGGVIPTPLFDTQVAAMVCGYGDQVGYETLVKKIARTQLDKSSRFTDWSRRPLSPKQVAYALGDVTHLRLIYQTLRERLDKSGRSAWLGEELAVLTDPATYSLDPREAWRRLKTRTTSGVFLAVARELAAWREQEAQARDVPRGRILKDDALLEVAAGRPKTMDELLRIRLLQREGRKPQVMEAILAAVARGVATPEAERPVVAEPRRPKPGAQALGELLKVLLKARAEESGVAVKLIASSADLEALANEDAPDIRALNGWRREVFGEDALRLKRGEIALTAQGSKVAIAAL